MTEMVEKIARAVLYEGYLLYPYRHSAIKNQQRWNFGVLYPPAWAAAQTGADRSYFRMECLAQATKESAIDISLRFLQLITRHADEQSWQEAVEQQMTIPALSCAELASSDFAREETFTSGDKPVRVHLRACAVPLRPELFRITLQVNNATECETSTREAALLHSLASAHGVMNIHGGHFISQTDPPDDLKDAVAGCQNTGVWPVLVGDPRTMDTMLGSPIILYDFPQIAPESGGDLFDGTEIDEILTLRVLTLTDKEKQELRNSDPRARQLLERLETAPPDHLLQLHGAVRGMQHPAGNAWSTWDTLDTKPLTTAVVDDSVLRKGDRVRLRPRHGADILDTFLAGKTAIIEAVEQDFENRIQFAVVLEDDPGRDLGEMRQAGHRFFFSVEEVEPLTSEGIVP